MHVVTASYFFDRFLDSPDALLDEYRTLTGWAEGLTRAGAKVTVVQRFSRDADIDRTGIHYVFVRCPAFKMGSVIDSGSRVNRAIARLAPDIVHVNGLGFARQAAGLRRALPGVPIVAQDHADQPPRRWFNRITLRKALAKLDAVVFAAGDLSAPWAQSGMLDPAMPVIELMEGSSDFPLRDRASARAASGLGGDPVCLWVGRLDENKDPITVLQGFAKALSFLPGARLHMVYSDADLLPAVEDWLHGNPEASRNIRLIGKLPHAELEAIYNSADFFLLGSHHEGSGYAVLEALACGVVPVVTDIPSFRALTGAGEAGGLWKVGDADGLARGLLRWQGRRTPQTPERQRSYFERNWSFDAIGRKAAGEYAAVLARRNRSADPVSGALERMRNLR
jgi:glycosyltransferase involved in cell wall biosynthesis